MNLHDQLNQVTKTKEEVYNQEYQKNYENSYDTCKFTVEKIRKEFLRRAENGMYQELENGKKYIEIIHTDNILKILLGIDHYITSEVSNDGRCLREYIHCNIWNKGGYDGFVKRMTEFAEEDGISFCIEYNFLQGAYSEFHRNDELCFPRGEANYDSFDFHIKCWVEY